jgi:hypothetical protein
VQKLLDRLDEIADDVNVNMEAIDRSPTLAAILDDQLNREAVALGLSQEDFQSVMQKGGQLTLTGAKHAGRLSLALLKKTAVLSFHAFQKTVVTMRTALDRSGGYDLRHTEQLLHAASGDGDGTFTDAGLARDLQQHGEVAADYTQVVQQILSVNDQVLSHVVSQSNHMVDKLGQLWKEKAGTTEAEVTALLATTAKTLVDEPRANILVGVHGNFEWPGSFPLLSMAKPHTLKVEVADVNAKELVKRLAEGGRTDISLKHRHAEREATSTLPVLSKEQAQSLLKAVLKLIHHNQRLLELLEGKHPQELNPELIPGYIDVLIGHHVGEAAAQGSLPQTVHAMDKVVTAYLSHFRYLNGRTVVTGLFNRNLETIRTLLRWVRESIKHYA